MVCIHCGSDTQVINSRPQKRLNQVWRRRKCTQCGAVFTTQEVAQYAAAWLVPDRNGRPQPFNRDKLFLSLHRSLQHRPSALTDAGALTDTVIKKQTGQARGGVIPRAMLVETAQVALHRFDKAAAVHYAAFHK